MDLHVIWFILLGVLLAGYAILDGFDFGVGILHPLAKTDHERRLFLNSIGPIWDGNEVWLVVLGGALFAAFRAYFSRSLDRVPKQDEVPRLAAGLGLRVLRIESACQFVVRCCRGERD